MKVIRPTPVAQGLTASYATTSPFAAVERAGERDPTQQLERTAAGFGEVGAGVGSEIKGEIELE